MSKILISLAAEYTGNKAFKQADTAVTKLNKSVKGLARTFGITFGTAAVVAYGKASVKAFAEDEAAATRLSRAVENLGLGFANLAIADYISKLEKSARIADDILRPAFQGLLTTTGSLTQSQKLLNNAITISRASGIDLATVTQDLAKAYVGVTKGLTKYNSGLTRAELTTMSFNEILSVILKRSAGAAEDYLDTTAYKLDVLSIAANNAKEVIGKGIVQALTESSGSINDAATDIERYSQAISDLIVDFGRLIRLTNAVPTIFELLTNPVDAINNFNKVADAIDAQIAKQNASAMGKNPIQSGSYLATQKKITKLTQDQQKAQAKILADKRLGSALDNANLALNKATDVFDMDKIQLNAAMINQADQLGKVTSQGQLLAITNDIVRLRIKQDILALEDAIASKDTARIEAATNQLNQDLKILGTLQNQNIKLADIKSILDSIMPKDLINQANLDEALRKIQAMMLLLAGMGKATTGGGSLGGSLGGSYTNKGTTDLIPGVTFNPTQNADRNYDLFNQLAQSSASANVAGINYNPNQNRDRNYDMNITINTGVGDPNAIAETLDQYLQGAVDRGTLRVR